MTKGLGLEYENWGVFEHELKMAEINADIAHVMQATISRWERRDSKISGPAKRLLKSLLPLYPDVPRKAEDRA